MDPNWLVLAHILLFVYWLGGDLGVFYSSRFVTDPTLGTEARATAAKIMLAVDLAPRICLILILPVGLTLAAMKWGLGLGGGVLSVIWVGCLAWLVIAVTIYLREGQPLSHLLARIDQAIRWFVIVLVGGVGVWSLVAEGPLAGQGWLAAKFLLFAVLVICGLAIRAAIRPFGPAFGRLMQEGSSPEVEAQLGGSVARARPFVLVIWAGLVVAAALGIFKPPALF
ncbi:MAG: hypothetical protein JJT93_05410 [Gammaproteobacteria bacterium]|nr:hypothetical protein [Gammaproteobacteria bacterium]